jgi:hypothetical protein
MTSAPEFIFQQLVNQAPVLLVYLIGLVLALTFWSRYPRPCAFTLIACLVLLLTRFAATAATYFFMQQMVSQAWSARQYGLAMSIVGLIASIVHAGALGLLLAAVFVDRSRPHPGPLPRASLDRPLQLPPPGSEHIRE